MNWNTNVRGKLHNFLLIGSSHHMYLFSGRTEIGTYNNGHKANDCGPSPASFPVDHSYVTHR